MPGYCVTGHPAGLTVRACPESPPDVRLAACLPDYSMSEMPLIARQIHFNLHRQPKSSNLRKLPANRLRLTMVTVGAIARGALTDCNWGGTPPMSSIFHAALSAARPSS